ncbi:MAG: SGNH/GDSL hydrolase family protein [Kineothrix sp.]
MKKEDNRRQNNKTKPLNWHLILLAAILAIAAVAAVKLAIWNMGTKSEYDPNNLAEGFDVEALDTIIPLSQSKLEGHTDDGVTTILCLGNNPLTDETGSSGFTAHLAAKTGATVYNGGFPESTVGARYSVYNESYPRDNFNLPYVAESIASGDFSRLENAASQEQDAKYLEAVETLKGIDYSKVDVIAIVYDAADYLALIPSDNPNDPYELSTYTGGLRNAIEDIQQAYPYIRIIVMSHTFAQNIDENGSYQNGGSTDLGNGALPHYLLKEIDVSISCGVSIIDNFYGTVNEDNYQEYMTDNIHLNDAGRELMAERLAEVINTGRTSAR